MEAPPAAVAAATPAPAPAVSSQSSMIQAGANVSVSSVELGGCLNLRESPGTEERVLQCLTVGETIRVLSGLQDADGYRWWQVPAIAASAAQSVARRHTDWATYYGIEDGFPLRDVMYDRTAYNPADPTMTVASFQLLLHSWLLVCTAVRC